MRKHNRHVVRIVIGFFSLLIAILACNLPRRRSVSEAETPTAETTIKMTPREPELGSTKRWIDGSLLVYIPAGTFLMGGDGVDNPEHEVYLNGFWIYRTEVTNQMYLQCMAKGECSPPAVDPAIPDFHDPERAQQPVIGVRWDQAVAYCRSADGTLPTEAQWEKTARGEEGNPYPWGDHEPECDLLNFNNCVGEITPVRKYLLGASTYEVLDMAGNVFEWVFDWYQEDYYQETPHQNPTGPGYGEVRSVRGSTYRSASEQVESSVRFFLKPNQYRVDLGFRCVVGRAQDYAPVCKVPAHSPPGALGDNPDEAPGGSASCVVPQPDISVVTYCEDDLRGNNISWSPADAEIDYSPSVGAWCVEYDEDTLACAGEPGSTVEIQACKSCPPPEVELGVMAACEPPYVLDEATELCRYDGPPIPGEVLCAPGYTMSEDENCCVLEQGTPMDFPACPVGGVFDPIARICWFLLPSTGDEKCESQSVVFDRCEEEVVDDGRPGGPVCRSELVGPDCEAAGGIWTVCAPPGAIVAVPCCICP